MLIANIADPLLFWAFLCYTQSAQYQCTKNSSILQLTSIAQIALIGKYSYKPRRFCI